MFAEIKDVISDIRSGSPVVILDDEDRENEGDLIIAAQHISAEHINFMATYGRGLICLTLVDEQARQLNLSPMVRENRSGHGTNFTVSIEASKGVTTGISAEDRATTVKAAIAEGAGPDSIVSPGHIFPLVAEPGGVLNRAGHTEAGCDLARLAGLKPAAVIVEILNPDGTMARRDQLLEFSSEHNLKVGTVADLIKFRLRNETSIEKRNVKSISTEFGSFDLIEYFDKIKKLTHYALIKDTINKHEPILVRVHVHDLVTDLFGRKRGEGWESPLKNAMYRLAKEKRAVLVLLTPESDRQTVFDRQGDALVEEKTIMESQANVDMRAMRTFGVGAQILRDLGVKDMRVLGEPKLMHGISGFGLNIVEYIPQY